MKNKLLVLSQTNKLRKTTIRRAKALYHRLYYFDKNPVNNNQIRM